MTIILGAGRDKGGHMSVKDCKVEVTNTVSENYIKSLFGLPGCGEGFSAGMPYEIALSRVDKAIIAIITCPKLIYSNIVEQNCDMQSQIVLNDLISIRGSIISSKMSSYEEYAIQIIEDSSLES